MPLSGKFSGRRCLVIFSLTAPVTGQATDDDVDAHLERLENRVGITRGRFAYLRDNDIEQCIGCQADRPALSGGSAKVIDGWQGQS